MKRRAHNSRVAMKRRQDLISAQTSSAAWSTDDEGSEPSAYIGSGPWKQSLPHIQPLPTAPTDILPTLEEIPVPDSPPPQPREELPPLRPTTPLPPPILAPPSPTTEMSPPPPPPAHPHKLPEIQMAVSLIHPTPQKMLPPPPQPHMSPTLPPPQMQQPSAYHDMIPAPPPPPTPQTYWRLEDLQDFWDGKLVGYPPPPPRSRRRIWGTSFGSRAWLTSAKLHKTHLLNVWTQSGSGSTTPGVGPTPLSSWMPSLTQGPACHTGGVTLSSTISNIPLCQRGATRKLQIAEHGSTGQMSSS